MKLELHKTKTITKTFSFTSLRHNLATFYSEITDMPQHKRKLQLIISTKQNKKSVSFIAKIKHKQKQNPPT